jgi:hypothetical protein
MDSSNKAGGPQALYGSLCSVKYVIPYIPVTIQKYQYPCTSYLCDGKLILK